MGRGRVWQGIRGWFRANRGDRRQSNQALARPAASVVSEPEPLRPTEIARIGPRPLDSSSTGTAPRMRFNGSEAGPGDTTMAATMDGVFDEACDERELLDFLAADLDPVPVDPVFRERLREELWGMIVDGQLARTKPS